MWMMVPLSSTILTDRCCAAPVRRVAPYEAHPIHARPVIVSSSVTARNTIGPSVLFLRDPGVVGASDTSFRLICNPLWRTEFRVTIGLAETCGRPFPTTPPIR